MTRRVMLARWSEVPTDYGPGLLRFEIRANAFCHQMVRAIVGTMVDAGAGRLHAGDVRGILLAKDRRRPARSPRRTACACGKLGTSDGNNVDARSLTRNHPH